jgi:hypothetical protein
MLSQTNVNQKRFKKKGLVMFAADVPTSGKSFEEEKMDK